MAPVELNVPLTDPDMHTLKEAKAEYKNLSAGSPSSPSSPGQADRLKGQ